ncbi:hypothetical protein BDW02DRAFT_584026 [Decorospora gaudefroyi]|uniref:RING-type domain-containing protein n=1 Tax=Decorospora gaudefroyi TaxID=184978 RepID=A0A6A5JXP1_9PLEO|nr:hypothetical protein BDW02DRAFT_584026 [Decorospora gaudefroyi]
MPVNSNTLTLATALEGRQPPPNEKCAICQELLTSAPPQYTSTSESESSTSTSPTSTSPSSPSTSESESPTSTSPNDPTISSTDMQPVTTQVCGPTHFFHRICITSWWTSATPNLNTCPLDRTVCYGSERVCQTAVNVPDFAEFLGHDPELHGDEVVDYVDHLVAAMIAAGSIPHPSPTEEHNAYLAQHPGEVVGPGDAYEGEEEEETVWSLRLLSDSGSDGSSRDEEGMPDRAYEDVADPASTDQNLAQHDGFGDFAGIGAWQNDMGMDYTAYELPSGHNNAFADSIARGMHPAPRVSPFGTEADPGSRIGLEASEHLVQFFNDVDAES